MDKVTNSINTNSPTLNSNELEIREYQINIATDCAQKNSLVVIPTGLGKTIIAVLVASKVLKVFPPNSKIIILAPTRPLINQHYYTFLKFLSCEEKDLGVLTGMVVPEKRAKLFYEKKILLYTPQMAQP